MLWIEEVEMVDSVDDFKSSRSVQGFCSFPSFSDAGCEECFCSGQDHSEFLLQEKGQSGGTEKLRKKIGSFAEDIVCMIYDYFRVDGAHDTVLDHADLSAINFRNEDVQEFDTGWDEILLSMTKKHLMISWKVCSN